LNLIHFHLDADFEGVGGNAFPASNNYGLTDREKQEQFINQEGYQDMLEEFLFNDYQSTSEMREIMRFYQFNFFNDLKSIKKKGKKLRFSEGK